jgi:uncharacterized membrane protein YraQ (UPF0718 family)
MSVTEITRRPFLQWLRPLDRVWLAFAAILGGLALVSPPQAGDSIAFTLASLWDVAPFLIASIAIAAYAQASGADGLIARAFSGRGPALIVIAALIGGLSPFCSCGVIPLIAALLAMGVPLAPVMAFWLASPVMDPSMFALTSGVLGFEFAIAKTLAAVGLGLLGGFGTAALQRAGLFAEILRPGVGDGGCGGARIRSPKAIVWRFWIEPARRRSFADSAVKNTLFLGKWLALAFLLESLMVSYLPAELVASTLGEGSWLPILVATLIGVPAYLNGYAALPVVGGLIGQGMGAGAAMSFLVAGGVTSLPAAIAVFAVARRPIFVAYIGFSLVGAAAAGFLYQAWTVA